MSERLNDTHHRYPRTMEEAFGPHCRQVLDGVEPPRGRGWLAVLLAAVYILVFLLAVKW